MNKKKNILILGDSIYPDSMGGSHRHMFELSNMLVKRGFNVIVITPKIKIDSKDYEVINGIKYYRFPLNKNKKIFTFIDFMFGSYKTFRKVSKIYKIDVIHGHWPLTNFLIFKFNHEKSVKKIYTFHGPMFEEYDYELKMNSIYKKFVLFIMKKIEKSVLKNSNKIIVASNYMFNKVHEIYGYEEKTLVIPVPTDTEKFKPIFRDKKRAKRALHIDENVIILLTIRRLRKRMGIDNLIDAFNKLIKTLKLKNIRLLIGGEGPLKNDFIKMIKRMKIEKNIELLGFVPENQIALYYEAADLFIIPSIDLEGFGLVTTEAMAMGTNVLATPIGGNKEILGMFNPEYLTRDTDSDSIFQKLYKIITEFDLSYCPECREFVESNYSWKENIKRIIDVYE